MPGQPVAPWWRQLTVASLSSDTDLCWHCGHVRWRHKGFGCECGECPCPGGMTYVVAGFVGDR